MSSDMNQEFFEKMKKLEKSIWKIRFQRKLLVSTSHYCMI